ncbi:hypothetical protein FIU97_17735 [Roseivivax sp. THAF40]|nr:hypothetical protein FIV09_17325 [Roseivivax sp. THAF197b]QFT48431.1 hypothetical protein FIU97_17735 [Roseivivax sp. THAF40]
MDLHLRPYEAVKYISSTYGFRYSPRYLAKLRSISVIGPKYVRHGGRIYYRSSDLDEWVAQRTQSRRSTLE